MGIFTSYFINDVLSAFTLGGGIFLIINELVCNHSANTNSCRTRKGSTPSLFLLGRYCAQHIFPGFLYFQRAFMSV